jgi:hypothetical protein
MHTPVQSVSNKPYRRRQVAKKHGARLQSALARNLRKDAPKIPASPKTPESDESLSSTDEECSDNEECSDDEVSDECFECTDDVSRALITCINNLNVVMQGMVQNHARMLEMLKLEQEKIQLRKRAVQAGYKAW